MPDNPCCRINRGRIIRVILYIYTRLEVMCKIIVIALFTTVTYYHATDACCENVGQHSSADYIVSAICMQHCETYNIVYKTFAIITQTH